MSHSLNPPATPLAAPAVVSPWLWFVAGILCAAGIGAGGATLYLMGQQQGAATAASPPLPAASATTVVAASAPHAAIPATLAVSATPVTTEQVQPSPAPSKTSAASTAHKPKPAVARMQTTTQTTKNIATTPPVEVAEATSTRSPAYPEWTPSPPPTAPALCTNCGTVESVVPVVSESKPSGVGALTGAALVGLLGNQFGRGDGKALATLAGVVGGAYAGSEIEKRMHQPTTTYRLLVRMDDGSARYVEQHTPSFGVGSRVSVQGNLLSPAPSVVRQGT